jgi:photosystem II stability/assembly factor-like uncharacterized protein
VPIGQPNHASKLLLGTRKGLVTLERRHDAFDVTHVAFEGSPVAFATTDPRNGVVWACLEHGHWGPKLHRSRDGGASFDEVEAPTLPERLPGGADETLAVDGFWCISPGGAAHPERIWLGTLPGALFRSDDGGDHFELVSALWEHPHRAKWFGGGRDTPGIHSILVDPRDDDHVLIAVSCGGVYATEDGGRTWRHRNEGLAADFLPEPSAEVGQDPHAIARCASSPDVIWQQNHCGVYRSVDNAATWTNVSQPGGPVHFGFPIVAHPERPETAWVIPGKSDEKRMAVARALAVHRTDDGGKSWRAQTNGLPQKNAFDVVYRHAFDGSGEHLAFGSTTGNAFVSDDGGEHWACVGTHLPPIYSVRFA